MKATKKKPELNVDSIQSKSLTKAENDALSSYIKSFKSKKTKAKSKAA